MSASGITVFPDLPFTHGGVSEIDVLRAALPLGDSVVLQPPASRPASKLLARI